MGYAKYHEDDLKIYDERMYYHSAISVPCIKESNYTRIVPKTDKIEYREFCPFCRKGFTTYKMLISHIVAEHGGVHEFVYLNNRKISGGNHTVKNIDSLKLYSFRENPKKIQITDNMGNTYSFLTNENKYEYDIQSILSANPLVRPYSEIKISNVDVPVCIRRKLDINNVTMEKILSGKYLSYLFDEQFAEGELSVEEDLIYLKMLIHEGTETESFIECIEQMHLEKSRDKEELYYYHLLQTGNYIEIKDKFSTELPQVLLLLLNGHFTEAEEVLSNIKARSNDKDGCLIISELLRNDRMGVEFLIERYKPFGFIGILEKILFYYASYEKDSENLLIHESEEIALFSQYPLIHALIELNDSLHHRSILSYESYTLLRKLTPLAAINYCYGIDDEIVREKVFKSMAKTHKDSILIKEHALKNDYAWMKRRIFVSDKNLYKRAVLRQNEKVGGLLSGKYIDNFPFDDQIQITPLGGEHEIGASCFVISFKGYNLMLDCGINTREYGNQAYPTLDMWNKDIDAIIISHAHIDHSGGVPKAHAMWPEAKIITTPQTKVFLKYLYSDMAKVSNGISDEFEIENVTIEKDVMWDTLNSMTTIDYEERIHLRKDIEIKLHPAGHIIGAAMIELIINGKTLLYTGDYCNYNQIVTGPFDLNTLPQNVDYLITEATYFKRARVDWNSQYCKLKKTVLKGIHTGKAILLPATSVGRSQELVCIIGEMKFAGEIPEDVRLYLAGMAIPATTQIIPFMNERYEEVVGLFEEFNGVDYPENCAIVIASSGTMSKGSASYKIARNWDRQRIKYSIIANGYLDEDTEFDSPYMDMYNQVQRVSLSTHVDLKGIFELIEYVSPKVISFVHRGTESESDIRALVNTCKGKFSNDIMCRDLQLNRCDKIFDMYEWFMEEECDNV